MDKFVLAACFAAFAGVACADGLSDPIIEPEIIEGATASSGGDNWVGLVMTLAVLGTALSK